MKRPLKVFLAHANDDKQIVRHLHDRLVRSGVRVWLDEERLLPGQNWEGEIRRAVQESDAVIVCLSKRYIEHRGYRHRELRIALEEAALFPEGEIFLIPARLEECEVPDNLRSLQRVDLFKSSGYGRLMMALKKRAGRGEG